MNVYKMNVICCFYLRDRLKKHPNFTYTETVEYCTIEYSLNKPFFILKWDKMNGVILELDREYKIVQIGTPCKISKNLNYWTDKIIVKPFLNGGYYWIDWMGAE